MIKAEIFVFPPDCPSNLLMFFLIYLLVFQVAPVSSQSLDDQLALCPFIDCILKGVNSHPVNIHKSGDVTCLGVPDSIL